MGKVGRNEPCPCGSGKKYKKCCERDHKVIQLFSGEITKEEAQEVRRLLEIFISDKKLRLSERLDEKFHLSEITEKNLKSAESLAFEWFVMDHPFEGEESLFEYFLREIRGKIDLPLIKKLDSWKKSYLSVYDVSEHLENERILLRDIFTKEEKILSVFGLETFPRVDDLLVVRLVPVEGIYEYFFGALGIDMFSRKTLIDLLALDKDVENKTWEAFLKEDGDQIVDNVIEMYFRGDETEEIYEEEDFRGYITFNFAVRLFLTEPQKVLQGKTALEAVYTPGMEKPLKSFLKRIQKGNYDDEDKYLIKFSSYFKEIEDLLTTNVNDLKDLINLPWEKATYKKEAELFVRKTIGRYFPEDIAKALTVWQEYCDLEVPDIRKTGTWASALDQLISNVFVYDDHRSRKEIAESYQISSGTISRNMKKLEAYFYDELEQEVGEELPDWMDELDMETLSEMERMTGDLGDKLEAQDFQSSDEAREYLEKLMEESLTDLDDEDLAKEEVAQELIYDAWELTNPKERISLARKALKIDPESVDAYVLLAEDQAKNIDEAMDYYRKGIKAGEKRLGKAFFKENEGDFWVMVETRPYMRAKMGLGISFMKKEGYQRAIKEFEEMLRLNPGDNQGVRSLLMIAYFSEEEYGKITKLFEEYYTDYLCEWPYNKALYTYIQEGESKKAKGILRKALRKNSYVPKYLLNKNAMPKSLPGSFTMGGEEEAMIYAYYARKIWLRTPGAMGWLSSHK